MRAGALPINPDIPAFRLQRKFEASFKMFSSLQCSLGILILYVYIIRHSAIVVTEYNKVMGKTHRTLGVKETLTTGNKNVYTYMYAGKTLKYIRAQNVTV